MKPLLTMVGAGLVVGLVATIVFGMQASLEAAVGTAGPLLATCGSWMVIERTMRRDPTQVTPTMLTLFAAKMLFFGLFVVAALVGLHARPVPFLASFTSAFITLYLIEAIHLQRLFTDGLRATR
jgi:hypothetical protein